MKDITTGTEKDTDTNSYMRRNIYKVSDMNVDGMSYRIVSVTPKADENYTPKTASDLIKYLISGK